MSGMRCARATGSCRRFPSLFVAAAGLLAFLLPALDAVLADSGSSVPAWIDTTAESARITLSTMAGAIITVAGTVFSITIVTLSLASQQFGPRLLRRFMHDLATQVTLGVFLATGFYCLLLLRALGRGSLGETVPNVSVLVAVVLVAVSVVVLIVFIHHIAMLIQAPQVVAGVAQDLNDSIERLYPRHAEHENDAQQDGARMVAALGRPARVLESKREGYIQALSEEGLGELAAKHDAVMRLHVHAGHFVSEGTALADVWLRPSHAAEDGAGEALAAGVNNCLVVGARRTPRQDAVAAVGELVEVAVRALSPGINDPFTAINCIDRLGAAMARLARKDAPAKYRFDDASRLRVITRPVPFGKVMDAAFDQIRQHARNEVAVTARVLEALAVVGAAADSGDKRASVLQHAAMAASVADTLAEEHDRSALLTRRAAVEQACGGDAAA